MTLLQDYFSIILSVLKMSAFFVFFNLGTSTGSILKAQWKFFTLC